MIVQNEAQFIIMESQWLYNKWPNNIKFYNKKTTSMVNLKTILVMVVIVAIATTAVVANAKEGDKCKTNAECKDKDAKICVSSKCVLWKVDKDCSIN